MQLRYIDYTDYQHLVNTLRQDYKPLSHKMKKLDESVRRAYGTIKKKADWNHIMWECPVSGNLWRIQYIHHFNPEKNRVDIELYPFTEFVSRRGEKVYLLLSKLDALSVTGSNFSKVQKAANSDIQNNFVDFLVKNNLFLILFRGHFIDRFRMRTTEHKNDNVFEVMFTFSTSPRMLQVQNYQDKHEWLMVLHLQGVAMTRQGGNYVVYDTFLSRSELRPQQLTAIKTYLDSLNDFAYGIIVFLIIWECTWLDIIDKDKLLRHLLDLARTNQRAARSHIEICMPALKELWGESFLDMFPFATKPTE
jgi:hypothetical protein